MTLSSSQLRLISTIGMGVLVGTSLIVIIPEGIEAVYTSGSAGHGLHTKRGLVDVRWTGINSFLSGNHIAPLSRRDAADVDAFSALPGPVIPDNGFGVKATDTGASLSTTTPAVPTTPASKTPQESPSEQDGEEDHDDHHDDPPTFYIGFSLILGFILMFLIDKLPRHASENLQPPPVTRHISLSNLSQDLGSPSPHGDEESESFLSSLAPSPKQTRSLATTTGLVIHAAADGIAMGASASSSNTKLGFIIFIAIMVHKAPAAFGLTSVLLKQGLSKRAARGHLIVFSLAAPCGALSTWLLLNILGGAHMDGERGQWWTGMLLLFSAGTFL
jgi:zinc transporter 9